MDESKRDGGIKGRSERGAESHGPAIQVFHRAWFSAWGERRGSRSSKRLLELLSRGLSEDWSGWGCGVIGPILSGRDVVGETRPGRIQNHGPNQVQQLGEGEGEWWKWADKSVGGDFLDVWIYLREAGSSIKTRCTDAIQQIMQIWRLFFFPFLFFLAASLQENSSQLDSRPHFYINIHYHGHSCNKEPPGLIPSAGAVLNGRAHIQQVWLYKSRAIGLRQHFNFLAFLRCKESLSLAPSGSPASWHSPDIRDKLVCHSLVIFTIRLKLPGQSHQNPIQEKNTHAPPSLSKRMGEILKNMELSHIVDGGLGT